MRRNLISLMACNVLLAGFAVAQQEGANPAAADTALIQQLVDKSAASNAPAADQAAAAEQPKDAAVPSAVPAVQPDKPAEQPPVAVAAEAPKAAEPAAAVVPEAPKVAEPPVAAAAEPAKAVEPAAAVAAEPAKATPPPAGNVLDQLMQDVAPAAAKPPAPAVAAPVDVPKAAVAATVEADKAAPPPAKIDVEGVVDAPPKAAAVAGAVEPAKPAVAKSPDVDDIENLQKVTRTALQAHAEAQLAKGEAEFKNGKFQDAVRFFTEASDSLDKVGDREGNEALKQRIYKGLGETFYNWAKLLMNERSFEEATKTARNAGMYWHPKTAELLAEIEKAKNKRPEIKATYPPVRWKQESYVAQERDIDARMKMGKQHYLTGEYDKAKDLYESVLRVDPENTEAIRMVTKIGELRERTALMEREMTRQGMITDTRRAWARRDYADLGELAEMRTNVVGGVRPPPDEVIRQQILAKMEKIVLPEIDFKQAHIRDVIDFLSKQSQENDKETKEEEKKGVNIVLTLSPGGAPRAEPAAAPNADPFAAAPQPGEAKGGGDDVLLITFQARHITLLESLKIVCNVANLKFRVEGSVVMVLPLNAPEGRIIHRMYDVLPSFIQRVIDITPAFLQGPGGVPGGAPAPAAGGADPRSDLKATFSNFGIAWPEGSSIQHLPPIGKLIVANTVDNLATFEKILSVLNVVPTQIEIEARFVEVRQTDIESLGFEWLLTDDYELMQRRGSEGLPLDQRQRIQIGAESTDGGLTRGNRFLRSGAMLPPGVGAMNDNILRVQSILTNPELTMILHAMEQKGNADLLSAPKVTTKSASEATIKVVREYIYPTEFTVTPIMGAAAGGINTVVGGVVEPGGFETREVGVILSVMPEVTPDGQMIDLTMTPQVVDEPDWENYGSEYIAPDGNVQRLPMRQPIFKARSVSTQLSIYNGSTVVLGGMINEIRNSVDDKIPLLGDLPFIGRLFRSKYDHSDKRNLLIFVTARMVDPGGRAIRSQKETLQPLLGVSSSAAKP